MTTLKNRRLAKVLWPAFLLTVALALPPAGQADPSPKAKAHAAEARKDKDKRNDKDNKRNKAVKVQKVQKLQKVPVKVQRVPVKVQKVPVRQGNVERGNAWWKQQQRLAEQRLVAQRRLETQRRLDAQRRVVVQRPVYVAPAARQPVRRFRWDGWDRRYSRQQVSGAFQLDGTFVDRQYGCAIIQDHRGQVIPLVGFNPLVPRRGEHFLLTGRVESGTSCGTAFRVSRVERVWADPNHRSVLFDNRYDGDYFAFDRGRERFDDNRRLISVDGELNRDRCPSIRTENGEVFGLNGDLRDYRDGEWVRVVGFLDGRSRCGGPGIEIGEISGA